MIRDGMVLTDLSPGDVVRFFEGICEEKPLPEIIGMQVSDMLSYIHYWIDAAPYVRLQVNLYGSMCVYVCINYMSRVERTRMFAMEENCAAVK